jgi:SAM-dependent methyltransferase
MQDRRDPRWIDELFDGGLYELEYAPFFRDDRTAAEAELIMDLLRLDATSSVLDLACGHGRHALLLGPQVGRLVGVDRSRRFVALARQGATALGFEPSRCEFFAGDLRRLELEERFDAAYSFFTSWGYYSDEENLEILHRARSLLRAGGRLLLELAARDGVVRCFRPQDSGRLPDGTEVFVENSLDLFSGRVHARRRYIKGGEERVVEIMHHLVSPDELVRLLERAGFEQVELFDGETGEALTLDSLRLAVVARVTR